MDIQVSRTFMRIFRPTAVVCVIVVALSHAGLAAKRSHRNPIGSSTVPPSAYEQGSFKSPNPMGDNGNSIITGNVRGGKEFRADVPYGSTRDFRGTLGSTTLDSFRRSSAGSESFGLQNRNTFFGDYYRRFYSETGSVAGQEVGRPGVFKPYSGPIVNRAPDAFGLQDLESPTIETDVSAMRLGPLQRSPEQLEKLINEELGGRAEARGLGRELYQQQLTRLRHEIEQFRDEATTADKTSDKGLMKDDYLEPDKVGPVDPEAKPLDGASLGELRSVLQKLQSETESSEQYDDDEVSPAERSTEKLEKPGRILKLEELFTRIRKLEQQMAAEKAAGTGEEADAAPKSLSQKYLDIPENYSNAPKNYLNRAYDLENVKEQTDEQRDDRQAGSESTSKKINDLSDAEIANRAQAILGHKSVEDHSRAKYRQYMSAGETYIRAGRYYRAADAYGLALVYKEDDPLANAGKSHALFGAGSYVTSALFLSRALEDFPAYLQHEVDLAGLLGADMINKRVREIKERLSLVESAELEYVLAYVYYRTGDMKSAGAYMDAAYEELAMNEGVKALKAAIEGAVAK